MTKLSLLSLSLLLTACVNPAFQAIQGKGPEDVRNVRGDPTTIVSENGHEMWTYRQNDCTQIIFFNNEKKVVDWHEMGVCRSEE